MIALKLSVFVLLLTVIIADDFKFDPAKDKPFRECCEKRNVHKKFLDVSCTYTSLFNSSAGPPMVDKDLISDLPDIVECSADGKDNIECCKKKGVNEGCLPLCNAKAPIELAKFAACRKESRPQKRLVLECYHENAYNKS